MQPKFLKKFTTPLSINLELVQISIMNGSSHSLQLISSLILNQSTCYQH